MKYSIIIRAYNEEKHIGRLLTGITQQIDKENTEVILVDSGSKDNTVGIARQYGAKVVHIAPEDFSFGRALNMGCEAATGEILIFASAHVYPIFIDWITKLTAPFKDNRVAVVYGRQTGNEVTKFSEHQLFLKWFPAQSNYDQSHPFCNNANCAIRKSLWADQPFDEVLTGLEDLDWAGKIMEKGYRIGYEADAVIVHVHEENYAKIKNRYRREAITLRKLYPKVRFNLWDFTRLFVTNTVSDLFHALQQKKISRHAKGIVAFRLMQFWGTYLGHQQRGDVNVELKNRFYYPNRLSPDKQDASESREVRVSVNYNV